MKRVVLLFALFALSEGQARPSAVLLAYQDSLGQYSFGYSAPGSARSEVRTSDGATRGSYSYVDEAGVIQSAHYVADGANGFRVFATNLPQAPLPVQDTPEVAAARAAHLQALQMAEDSRQENVSAEENSRIVVESKAAGVDGKIPAEATGSPQRSSGRIDDVSTSGESDEDVRRLSAGNAVGNVEEIVSENSENQENAIGNQETTDQASMARVQSAASVPVFSTHVLLPDGPGQQSLSRASEGQQGLPPSAVPQSSIGQDGKITPAGTSLSGQPEATSRIANQESMRSPASENQHQVQHQVQYRVQQPVQQPVQRVSSLDDTKPIIGPVSVLPVASSHSNYVSYVHPTHLQYIAYNLL